MARGGHIEVAQAYVTIIPSMEGIQKKISNEMVPAVTTAADEAGKKAGTKISDGVAKGGKDAGTKVGDALDSGGRSGADKAGKSISSTLTNATDSAAQSMGGKLSGAFEKVSTSVGSTFGSIGQKLDTAFGGIGIKISSSLSPITERASSIFSKVTSTASSAGSSIGNAFSRVTSTVSGAFSKVSSTASTVSGTVSGAFSSIKDKVSGAFSGVADKVSSTFGGIKDKITAPFSGIAEKITGPFKSVSETAERELGSAGEKGAQGFGGAFSVAAGNLLSQGLMTIGTKAAETFVQGFMGYANFEQLSGGVEKIFDQANTSQIFKDAQNAFKDLNMSANQYLESINSVGATFAQTMGDQKGYDTARTGMKAIADYASGTGANLENLNEKYQLITRSSSAYQSIADQFAGILPQTSKDFLEQAQQAGFLSDKYQKLTEVPVAEYQEAVTKMLEQGVDKMGLAGNTLAESTNTISGSLAMLSGAWDNFLTGIFDENADLGALGENLMQAIGAVITNVAPRIGEAIVRVVQTLPGAIIEGLQALPGMLEPTITEIFGEQMGGKINEVLGGSMGGLGEKFSTLMGNLGTTLTNLYETVQPILELLGSAFEVCFNVAMVAIQNLVDYYNNNWLPLVNSVLEVIRPVIEQISADLQEKMPAIQEMITNVMNGIKSVIDAVWPAISDIVVTAVNIIGDIIEAVWPVVSEIIDVAVQAINVIVKDVFPVVAEIIKTACEAIKAVIDAVWPVLKTIIEGVMNAIKVVIETVWPVITGIVSGACDAIKGAIDGIQTIVGVVQGIFDGVRHAIEDPIGTAKGFIEDAINAIKGFFNFDIQWPHIPLPHFSVSGSPNPLDWIDQGPPSFSIDWYAKGGFVDGVHLIGVGERGPEMILPQSGGLMDDFAEAVTAKVEDDRRTDDLLEALLDKSGDVYLDGRVVGKVISPFVDAEFAASARRAAYA